MENDLISRDALYESLHKIGGCDAPKESWADGWDKAIDAAIGLIEAHPAAQAGTVVHGKWEISCDGYYPYCTNCMYEPKSGVLTNYCPHCGAKMDGKDDAHA